MGSNRLSGKTRCDISYSDIEVNTSEFKEMVSEPKFVCRKCRRVAVEKKNLCKAKKLKTEEKDNSKKTAA